MVKTNQFGNRLLKIPLAAIPGSVLCPVTAYYNMVKLNPASETGPAFIVDARKLGASRQAPLSYKHWLSCPYGSAVVGHSRLFMGEDSN